MYKTKLNFLVGLLHAQLQLLNYEKSVIDYQVLRKTSDLQILEWFLSIKLKSRRRVPN